MNSYERVMSALRGEPVDRPPVLAVLGFYGSRLSGIPVQDLFRSPDHYVAAQQAVIDTFGIDMVLPPFELSLLAEAFSGDEAFFDNQAPNMKRPPAANIGEALEMEMPDPHRTARLPYILETTRRLAEIYHGIVPVFSVLPGPAILPALMLGLEGWIETLLFDQPAANRLLAQSGKFWIEWANAQLEAGTDALIVTEGMAAATIATRDLFEEKCLPHVRACFAAVNGPVVFHHTGGPINHVIDLIPGLPNLMGIAVSSQDDLYEARRKTGSGVTLFGNIDNLSFRSVSANHIRTLATACLTAGKEIEPFILCNSGADLPIDTPPENIHALREAAEVFAARATQAQPTATQWICCGILQAEVSELFRRGVLRGSLVCNDSMLHMDPTHLETTLSTQTKNPNNPIILIYGDCCSGMIQLAERPNVHRVDRINCCQLLLGKARYRELMHQNSFILLPEWALRWKEVIEQELGLRGLVARDFFQETRKEIVYLDTGLAPVPEKELTDCAEYTGLPYRVEKISLYYLQTALLEAETAAKIRLR